ncbi:MAG: GNAT family N-acetyltransferase [Bacteroidota bacterium]
MTQNKLGQKVTIRQANLEDLSAIHGLVGELAAYEKESAAFVASLEDYQRDFSSGVFQAFVAELDQQIIGMALYYTAYSTWKGKMLWLEDFVVKEAYRTFGVGQRLFDQLILHAQSTGCRLMKWQVLDWNTPAIKFYEKNESIIEKNWWNGKILF